MKTKPATDVTMTSLQKLKRYLNIFSAMRFIINLILVLIFFTSAENAIAQGVITQTTSVDFNKGTLNNVSSVSDNVALPYQSNGFNVNWTATTSLPNKRSQHKRIRPTNPILGQ